MDLQQLQNFLIVAQEENITHAAEYLHITQPALSRQMQTLEKEFGKQLLIRENKKTTLTKDGVLLRKRANDIVNLVNKTSAEMSEDNSDLAGQILLGVSETDAIKYIGHCAKQLIDQHPKVSLKLLNGDNNSVLRMVNNGLVDIGLYFGEVDQNIFNQIKLPQVNRFGALMPKNHPLADKDVLTSTDLVDEPLILYQGSLDDGTLPEWFQRKTSELNIVATFGMYMSAKKLVESGLGIALIFDDLVDYQNDDLVCLPIEPALETNVNLIWKKYQVFSDSSQALLSLIKDHSIQKNIPSINKNSMTPN
ncbi:LysR family transcriptional regulator [Companilactobacillus kimchiensis]|nr:LysR family transcriptional regulator [Companilactobacillus kimchiensis]